MTFAGLILNVTALSNQAANRVYTLRSGICLIGSAAETWDDARQCWRLPTAEEFTARVWANVPRKDRIRDFTNEEARQLVAWCSHMARTNRRHYPHLT